MLTRMLGMLFTACFVVERGSIAQPSLLPSTLAPSALFGTNMVLQESGSHGAVVFGFAPPGSALQLLVSGSSASTLPRSAYNTTADPDTGAWEVTLVPYVPAADDPNNFTLSLQSSTSAAAVEVAVAHNVSFGTVLLCSGQSNMALDLHPIYDNGTIIAAAHHPEIRLFAVPPLYASTPQPALPANNSVAWQQTTPETVASFSGLCYLTALEIERTRAAADASVAKRPRYYGLVRVAIGSTDVQSWMSDRARAAALATCWTPSGATALPPSNSHNTPKGAESASVLWNAMVAPLAPNAFGALLWDQGENNAHYCSR